MEKLSKKEFILRMGMLYDNYSKVKTELDKEEISLVRHYMNNSQDVQKEGGSIKKRCWQAWDKFCEVVKGIDRLEYIDLLKYIAGNKLCVDVFIEDCIG